MATLPKTCDEIAHPRLPIQDRNGAYYCYNCIIEAFQAKGYNLACRMLRDWALAEDALQDSFLSGYRAFSQFRGDNLNAWMMRIIANTCRDFLRSRRARPIVSLDPLPTATDDPTPSAVDLPAREESPEEYAEREELRRAIISGLDRLPEERRLAVILVDVQGLSYEEAAQVMNCSIGTVKSRISRGRVLWVIILSPGVSLAQRTPTQETAINSTGQSRAADGPAQQFATPVRVNRWQHSPKPVTKLPTQREGKRSRSSLPGVGPPASSRVTDTRF